MTKLGNSKDLVQGEQNQMAEVKVNLMGVTFAPEILDQLWPATFNRKREVATDAENVVDAQLNQTIEDLSGTCDADRFFELRNLKVELDQDRPLPDNDGWKNIVGVRNSALVIRKADLIQLQTKMEEVQTLINKLGI